MKKFLSPVLLLGLLVAIVVVYMQFSGESETTIPFGSEPDLSGTLPGPIAKTNNKLAKLPDFSVYTDVKEKKETFFTTLYPIIEYENQHIVKVRQVALALQQMEKDELSTDHHDWLEDVADHYKVTAAPTDEDFFKQLLLRVDYIPPSLALTQAAIESGWGSSRFSKTGNNLFGQWCFEKGCGMVPSSRDSGKDHEVAKFKTVNDSVRAYLRNLNTNHSYESLREKRANIRKNNQPITGPELAKTLLKYSEEGSHYVEKVTKFINQNKLQRFTAQFEQSLLPVELSTVKN